MAPKSVIIVGGSVAGLLQGLQLKRSGSNVIVLEQDPSKDRHSHESGVSIGPTVVSLLEKYDATGRPAAIPTQFMSAAWRQRLRVVNTTWPHNMSNWGCLYLILRANFDGMASETVPCPPPPKPTDGNVEYRGGKRVTGVSYNPEKGLVRVQFVDVTTAEESSVTAEMVIAADGVHSTVRKLLQIPTRETYAGAPEHRPAGTGQPGGMGRAGCSVPTADDRAACRGGDQDAEAVRDQGRGSTVQHAEFLRWASGVGGGCVYNLSIALGDGVRAGGAACLADGSSLAGRDHAAGAGR
ncbi:hypothetical protein BP6252_11338 [Coleophoma cylindrospora]|uniref:FAD-binding domain-containing protein n=1 Tax=Coleophoma cylindrospora TaxID=1849047 RepID=A0A3D8QPP4_9HELO|nr:hypothetical protein BP6252_11338 [Coleophoma cylindrospora]